MFADLVQNSLDGLSAGAAYALLAVGFTLIFGVLRRVNLSYGPAIMLGCYAAAWVSAGFHLNFVLLLGVAGAGAVVAGAYVERICFAPHRNGSAIAAMVASFALWMQFEEAAMIAMPRHVYPFPALYDGGPLDVAGFTLTVESLVLVAAALGLCLALRLLLYRTRFGLAVRAIIDAPAAAQLAGIHIGSVSIRVFALASAIGGLSGCLIAASHQQVTPMMGMWFTLKGLLAMMLGGLGSLPGAVIGGIALGLVEAHSQWFLGPQARDLIAYLLLFVLLAMRPRWMNTRSAY